MLQDQGDTLLAGVSSSNPSFSKASAAFPVPLPGQSRGAPLSLDSIATAFNPGSHSEWPQSNQSQAGYPSTCMKQEPLSIPLQEPTLSLDTSTSSLLQHPLVYRTEKTIDFNPVKQEQKGAGGSGVSKLQSLSQSAYPPPPQPPPPQPSPAQKMSLDKYREKHTAEQAVSGPKRKHEQHGGLMDCDVRGDLLSSSSTYAPSTTSQVDHKKHSQAHQTSHGFGGSNTASPVKMKVPSSSTSGQDRRHHSDKRDKGSLKLRLVVPGTSSSSQLDKSGQPSKDELKMKIKVSSERHSSSDEGMATNNNKSKHSSPLVSKEKHRGAEHNLHRHHKHSHPHTHSGNGRGGPEGPGGGVGMLRGPPGQVSMDGTTLGPPGSTSLSSSRKRTHDAGHNHHPSSSTSCSKVSKSSKGGSGAAGTSSFSSPFSPPCSSPVLQCVSTGLQLYG